MRWRTRLLITAVPMVLLAGTALSGFSFNHFAFDPDRQKNAVIEKIVAYLKGKNVDMQEDKLKAVVHTVYDQSQKRDIDYRLALAVITVESNFKGQSVSNKGARGLFQIKPSLARYIAKDAGVAYSGDNCLHESDKNIKLGVYHLSKLVDDFKNLPTALHAYNVGETRTKARMARKGVPKNTFTKRVMKEYQKNISVLPEVDEP